MKKFIRVLICLLVVIIVGVGGYFAWQKFSRPSDVIVPSGDVVTVDPGLAAKAIVKTVQIKENASGANRIIDVKYPSIQSFKNKDFQNYVNNMITNVIFAYKDEIMVMIDEETDPATLYKYVTSFDKFTNGNYLSLVISNDYETGGIRSSKWKDIYNIDMSKERIFYLEEIFPAHVNYKAEIIKEITKQAEDKGYTLMNGEGLQTLNDKQKFFINGDKLVIYFDPAEIAPATYGELQFEMPFTLDEDGKFNP